MTAGIDAEWDCPNSFSSVVIHLDIAALRNPDMEGVKVQGIVGVMIGLGVGVMVGVTIGATLSIT